MEVQVSNQQHAHAADDILFEILSWMPAKEVIKHSSLLNNTLLSQPQFILKQTMKSSSFNGGFFVQSMYTNTRQSLSFHVLPTESPTAFGIPNDSFAFFDQRTTVLTSDQGLLIFKYKHYNRIFICNPITKAFAEIPGPTNIKNIKNICPYDFILRFRPGNIDFANNYTVVAAVYVDPRDGGWSCVPRLAVYHNGEWLEETCNLVVNPGAIRDNNPVRLFTGPNNSLVVHFLNQILPFYPLDLEAYVEAYDIDTMTLLKRTSLPKGAWHRQGHNRLMQIFNWGIGETLGLVMNERRRLTVWALDNYMSVKWRKVVEKTVSNMGVLEEEGDVVGCSVVNGTGLLFATSTQVYCYEMEGPNSGRFEVVGSHDVWEPKGLWRVFFINYANTLRPVHGANCSLFV